MSLATLPSSRAPSTIQLGGAAAMQQTIDDLNTVREFVGREMKDGLDYGLIPGTGKKKVLYLPGAQKINMYFNCYPEYEIQPHELDRGHVEYIVKTKLLSRSSQSVIGSGIGSCCTMESKYRWRNSSRACPQCGETTIIRGKAEYGGGWLCHKKQGGCGRKYQDGDPAIESQAIGRVENPDIYDQRNTVLKMGKKRSLVDASIGLSCLSEFFTQDLEDFAAPEPEPDREAINKAFPAREAKPSPATAERPSREPWASFLARLVHTTNDTWKADLAMAGIPEAERKDLVNQFQVINEVTTRVIAAEVIPASSVTKDGKPDGPRDRDKSKRAVIDLYNSAEFGADVVATVETYLAGKLDEARANLGAEPGSRG